MRSIAIFVSAGALLFTACRSESDQRIGALQGEVTANAGAEFRFDVSQSRFRLGSKTSTITEGKFWKVIGDRGVFAVDQTNGAILAVSNAGSDIVDDGPLTADSDEHNAVVRDYFEHSGLPAAEIASINAHAMMMGGIGSDGRRIPDRLLGFTSFIQRSVSGVPVVESYAWARFNGKGEVVAEGVYWPAISLAAVEEGMSIRATLNNPAQRQDVVQRINLAAPAVAVNPEITAAIHHTPSTSELPMTVRASVDAILGAAGQKPRVGHFDPMGREFALPSESEHSTSSAQRTR